MNDIKKEILEQFEEEGILFLEGEDDKLVGYAEMFGNPCIVLYKGINFIPFSPDNAIDKIQKINPEARTHDGSDNSIIGHLILEDGSTVLLYNRDSLVEDLKKSYMEDESGIFEGEDDCNTSAWEWYYVNSLGSYMDGIPAFAALYSK